MSPLTLMKKDGSDRAQPAKPSELQQIARIGAEAFANEPIYKQFYPGAAARPGGLYHVIMSKLTNLMAEPGTIALSLEVRWGEEGWKPVGYVTGVRRGTREQKEAFDRLVHDELVGSALPWTNTWFKEETHGLTRRDQGTNRPIFQPAEPPLDIASLTDKATILSFAEQETRVWASVTDTNNMIEWPSLAILPEYQGQGIGSGALDYVTRVTNELGVDSVWDASQKWLPVYLEMGAR